MSHASNLLLEQVKTRAKGMAAARDFFVERKILEVDPIFLGKSACIDTNIDLFEVISSIHGKRFLFSSPEYPMKRILSEISQDIYYLGHVFRHEECGKNHSPEFLMAEWYRVGYTFEQMIEETLLFCRLFITIPKTTYLSYQNAFITYAKIDPFTCSHKDLLEACRCISGYPLETSSTDELLNLILSIIIEPQFDPESITVLYHYPPSQASLSKITFSQGHNVALRFELYAKGLELANGYEELTCQEEQKQRFIHDTVQRIQSGKSGYPIDTAFLESLKNGLPPCCGVAVGMDRLFMIQKNRMHINDVFPIPFEKA